ncbi:unnamed protein product [Merluccius merluccius]
MTSRKESPKHFFAMQDTPITWDYISIMSTTFSGIEDEDEDEEERHMNIVCSPYGFSRENEEKRRKQEEEEVSGTSPIAI